MRGLVDDERGYVVTSTGTELDTPATAALPPEAEFVTVLLAESGLDINVLGSGGGKEPPDRNEGHNERSSGSDEEVGER